MKYYLTSPLNSNWLDLWCDNADSYSIRHIKRLKGIPLNKAPLFKEDPEMVIRDLHVMEPYILEESEDLDELMDIAAMRAL